MPDIVARPATQQFGNEYRRLDPRERHTHVHPDRNLTSDIPVDRVSTQLVATRPTLIPAPHAVPAEVGDKNLESTIVVHRLVGGMPGYLYSRPRTIAPAVDRIVSEAVQRHASRTLRSNDLFTIC